MSLIGITLLIIMVIIFFSLVLGQDFLASFVEFEVNESAIIDGISSTFVIESEKVIFYIDTSNLLTSGIALLTTIILVALGTGITVLGTGINPESARIVILLTAYFGLWTTLGILAYSLIVSIEIFGTVIYIALTIGYSVGVIQKISGGK